MGMTFDDRKARKMFKEIKTKVGGTGSVVIGPHGHHKNMPGTTLAGELGSYHFLGRGNNPKRDPLGFGKDGRQYWHRMVQEILKGKRTVKSALENFGDFLVRKIVLRMTQGIDHQGRAFKAYSKPYAKHRRENNKSTNPNLQYTGGLRESVKRTVLSK